jgi:hypothetical protein
MPAWSILLFTAISAFLAIFLGFSELVTSNQRGPITQRICLSHGHYRIQHLCEVCNPNLRSLYTSRTANVRFYTRWNEDLLTMKFACYPAL